MLKAFEQAEVAPKKSEFANYQVEPGKDDVMWTKEDLLALDAKYAKLGVPMHERSDQAAMDVLGDRFSPGFGYHPEANAIIKAYDELFPEGRASWPGAGIGICASVDRVRKVTLPIILGQIEVETWKMLSFDSHQDWAQWCRADADIASQTSFAAADLVDFIYGVEAKLGENIDALRLWRMSRSNLEDIANVLPTTFSTDSVLQPICLVAELAIKGTLVFKGADAASFGKKGGAGHDLKQLAADMSKTAPYRDDALVAEVVAQMPNYVQSRYAAQELTRLKVVQLAMGAQFIAGSALRRLGDTDMASEMESGGWPAPRRPFFS